MRSSSLLFLEYRLAFDSRARYPAGTLPGPTQSGVPCRRKNTPLEGLQL